MAHIEHIADLGKRKNIWEERHLLPQIYLFFLHIQDINTEEGTLEEKAMNGWVDDERQGA